ncbi:MAG: DUF1653 domain-containing protein [Candidatus Pacebacteria bacterium]|nr:DUF1653 domain-containing protein [Candidatus Paceibacterota bacterium]
MKTEFYYHYKHDPKDLTNFAYEVLGEGYHTEDESKYVIYRRLYKDPKYWLRPYNMFFEEVTKEGKTFLRFQKITDGNIINELKKISEEMYKS